MGKQEQPATDDMGAGNTHHLSTKGGKPHCPCTCYTYFKIAIRNPNTENQRQNKEKLQNDVTNSVGYDNLCMITRDDCTK